MGRVPEKIRSFLAGIRAAQASTCRDVHRVPKKLARSVKMKTAAFVILFLIGAIQIAFGVILGRLRIYAIEAPFWRDLALSEQHGKFFSYYIDILKNQWSVVTWLGIITVVATGFLGWSLKRA